MRFYSKVHWCEKNPFLEQDFLFEIKDFTPEIGKPFSYKGKTYYSFCVSHTYSKAVIKEITINDKEDYCFDERNIKCPCCGYEDENSFEAGDWDDSYQCPHCGAILSMTRHCEVTYSTEVIERPEIIFIEDN